MSITTLTADQDVPDICRNVFTKMFQIYVETCSITWLNTFLGVVYKMKKNLTISQNLLLKNALTQSINKCQFLAQSILL